VLLIGFGTVGYRLLEGWSWFDSFYVAVITLTSIGYGQRAPLTIAGRVFTLVLALGGIFTVAFVATKLLSTIITGELRDFWGKRRMAKRIGALEDRATAWVTRAERAVSRALGGSCSMPLAAHAAWDGDALVLRAVLGHPLEPRAALLRAGEHDRVDNADAAEALGRRVAAELQRQGAAAYLDAAG